MASAHAPQSTLCPFDHALCLGFTAWAVMLSPAVRSKVRSNLFLRTFLSFRTPLCTFWPARRADFLSIVAPEQPYFAGKTPFARLRPCCRNSRADAKVVTGSPTERRSRCSASRIEASSSTTNIMASTAVMAPSHHCTRAVAARCFFDTLCSAPLALPGRPRHRRGLWALACALLRRRPQGKLHGDPGPSVRHRPQPPAMLLHDRATDRQPHP
jgi:hypothetical protein